MQTPTGRAMEALTVILKAALAVVAVCVVVSIAWMFVPVDARNAITIFALRNGKTAILVITSLIFALYLYRLARNIHHSCRAKRVGLAFATLGFLALFYLVNFRGVKTDDTDCQRFIYNVRMNGGIKQVDGTTYIVNICGSGAHGNGLSANQNEQVKLVVTDAHGTTLASRLFFVFWDGRPGEESIRIRDDRLIYFDASDEYDSMRSISMPPSAIDWIAARIPAWLR